MTIKFVPEDFNFYVCVHPRKGMHECVARTTYEAANKAAAHWRLSAYVGSGTARIDVYLANDHQPKAMKWGGY